MDRQERKRIVATSQASVRELADQFGVSTQTIYRDRQENALAQPQRGAESFAMRNANRGMLFSQEMRSGIEYHGGQVSEEFQRELQDDGGVRLYTEMATNPVVAAVLFAIEMAQRQVSWYVEPGGDKESDQKAAEFVDECLNDMSATWDDVVSQVFSMLTYGFSVCELVYKKRLGQKPGNYTEDAGRSRFSDGRIGWRRWQFISPKSMPAGNRWTFDDYGRVQEVHQQPAPDYQMRTLPVTKGLIFRTTNKWDNPEGISCLRAMYMPYYYAKNLSEVEAIGAERLGVGLPVMYMGAGTTQGSGTTDYDEAQNIVRNVRADEQMGVVIPYPKMGLAGEGQGVLFELVSPPSRGLVDFNQVIERYEKRMAMTVLAQFIFIGMMQVGTQALNRSATDTFQMSIGAWSDMVADVVNRFAIPRLMALNPFKLEQLPTLAHSEVGVPDLQGIAEFVNKLVSTQVLTVDDELEKYLRELANFPEKPEPEVEITGDGEDVEPGQGGTEPEPEDDEGPGPADVDEDEVEIEGASEWLEELSDARFFTVGNEDYGGPGSGHHGHKGIKGRRGGSVAGGASVAFGAGNPEKIAARSVNIANNGSVDDVKGELRKLGYSDEALGKMDERRLRQLARKRTPAQAGDWLESQDGEFVTLYHGTTDLALEAIAKDGLTATPSTFANAGQEAGVFGVADHNVRWSEYWGNKAVERHGGNPVILEMKVPRTSVRVDPANKASFMYTPSNVKPSQITNVTRLSKTGTENFPWRAKVPDPDFPRMPFEAYVNDVFTGNVVGRQKNWRDDFSDTTTEPFALKTIAGALARDLQTGEFARGGGTPLSEDDVALADALAFGKMNRVQAREFAKAGLVAGRGAKFRYTEKGKQLSRELRSNPHSGVKKMNKLGLVSKGGKGKGVRVKLPKKAGGGKGGGDKGAANRATVAGALENKGVSAGHLDALAGMKGGQQPDGETAAALEKMKLVERAGDDMVMTAAGRSLLGAGNAGDVDKALAALAKADKPAGGKKAAAKPKAKPKAKGKGPGKPAPKVDRGKKLKAAGMKDADAAEFVRITEQPDPQAVINRMSEAKQKQLIDAGMLEENQGGVRLSVQGKRLAELMRVGDWDAVSELLGEEASEGDLDIFASVSDAQHTGVMVAFAVPQDDAKQMALSPDDLTEDKSTVEPAKELHLTLAYLGDSSEMDVTKEDVELVLGEFASKHPPVTGIVGGVGRFKNNEGDGLNAFYASFDSPILPAWRQSLVEALNAIGLAKDTDHGFTPHITLAYLAPGEKTPEIEAGGRKLTFDSVVLAWAGEWEKFKLEGTEDASEVGGEEFGGPGSGHHGHKGIKGRRGGSAAGTSMSVLGPVREDGKAPIALDDWGGERKSVANRAVYDYDTGTGGLATVEHDGEVVGVIGYSHKAHRVMGLEGEHIELYNVATKRSGYGRATLQHSTVMAAEQGKGLYLKAVPNAVGFYDAAGMNRHPMWGSDNIMASFVERTFYWSPSEVKAMAEGFASLRELEPSNGVFVATKKDERIDKLEGTDNSGDLIDEQFALRLKRGGPKWERSTNAYEMELRQTYAGWADKTAAELSGVEDDATFQQRLEERVDELIAALILLGRRHLPEAHALGLAGQPASPRSTAELADAIAENERYLIESLGPGIIDKVDQRTKDEPLITADKVAMAGLLATFLARVGSYAGTHWATIMRGFGDRVKQQETALLVKMRQAAGVGVEIRADEATVPIIWRLDVSASHCRDCPDLAGIYESWDALMARTGGGTPGSGFTECRSNCRCWLEAKVGEGWGRVWTHLAKDGMGLPLVGRLGN